MSFDKAHCRWKVLGDAAEVKLTENKKAILLAMSPSEDMTPKEISEASEPHISENIVRGYLRRMLKEGDVVSSSRGKYRRNVQMGGKQDGYQ